MGLSTWTTVLMSDDAVVHQSCGKGHQESRSCLLSQMLRQTIFEAWCVCAGGGEGTFDVEGVPISPSMMEDPWKQLRLRPAG